MSAIRFNHLKPKTIQQPTEKPARSIWQFFKSQMGLFGGTPEHRPASRIPFATQKEKTDHNIGEVKHENGKQYIFLETTIGKPRWHSHEELVTMAKEGKKIPEIAKKKMPGLDKEESKETGKQLEWHKKENSPKYQTEKSSEHEGYFAEVLRYPKEDGGGKYGLWIFSVKPIEHNQYISDMTYDSLEEAKKNAIPSIKKAIEKKTKPKPEPEPEPKQAELIKPESNVKKKSTPVEKYVQDKIRQGDNEPAISRQQEMRKNEATEKQKEQQEELSKLIGRKAQLQREIGSELEASKKVKKGGQEYEVDTKDVARQEMKQIDKKIGNLKQALGKLGENVFEQQQHEDMFSQAEAKPKDALSDNINKKVVEQGEKEKPSLKTLMATQSKVLELAEIPEEDIAMYALNSLADGAKLRSYSTEVIKGEMTEEQAAEKVKNDYSKMKEGEKPTNAGELPSTEEKKVQPEASTEQKKPWEVAKENIKPYEESLRKLTEKELRAEDKKISDAINKWANDTPTILNGKLNPKIGNDPAYFELSEKLAAIGREQESRKDTLPLLPSEKDSKEGDTKSINGITYELKRGESGELRWHRMTEEEKKEESAKLEGDKDNIIVVNGEGKEAKISKTIFQDWIKAREHLDKTGSGHQRARNAKLAVDREAGFKVMGERIKPQATQEELQPKESITMPRQEALEEHKNLVNVLENGTEEERKAEAEKQQKELEGYEEGMDENSSQEEPSLKDQVEERLNEKQESKKFKDAGTRVGGSKKEMAAIRVLTADDITKLDNATAYKVVTKERILPDIDAEAEKANGVESGAAYLKKKLREALMAKPLNSPEDRKKYIETIPKVFEKIDACKTIEELRSIGNDYFDIWHSFRSNKVQAFLKDDKNNELSSVLGKEFCNLIARNSDSAKEHWSNAKLMSPMSQEESDERYKQYEEARKNGLEVNKKRMDEYTPEQWERYFRNDPATTFSFSRKQLNETQKKSPEKYQEAIKKHIENEYKRNVDRNEILPYEKWLSQNQRYAPREANWDWANPKDKKAIQKVKDELQIHDSPPLAFIKRTNGREVKASDITPEAIKSKYGFASVQFGHYVKDNEAKEHVRHFIESMNDLEDALGIDIKKMNQLSGLSIAFGARGGGKALAHYEPMAKIINITKSNGDGSIAHELFHNIDHLLAGMKEGTRKEKVYLSQQQLGGYVRNRENDAIHRTPIHQAMQGVMDAIKSGSYEATANFQPGENKNTYGSIRKMFEDKGFEYTKDYLLHRYSLEPKEAGNAIDYFKYLATLSKKPLEIKYDTKQTKFYTGAKSFKSDYWQREPELLARAAEAYVQDRVMGKGMYNNYLVAGNNIQQPDMKYEGGMLEATYPQGEERIKINEAFDKLIQAAKDELNIGVDKPKEGKRISSEVQMQKSLYNTNVFEAFFRRLR
jgi:hypothetical protein